MVYVCKSECDKIDLNFNSNSDSIFRVDTRIFIKITLNDNIFCQWNTSRPYRADCYIFLKILPIHLNHNLEDKK